METCPSDKVRHQFCNYFSDKKGGASDLDIIKMKELEQICLNGIQILKKLSNYHV